MKLIKETFMALSAPEKKIKRTPIDGYSGLYCEQNQNGYTFQYSYKSPVTNKYRFMKLSRYKYGDNINKKMLVNIVNQLIIQQGQVLKGVDPMEVKKAVKQANLPAMQSKTVNKVFNAFVETHHYKQLSEASKLKYQQVYKNHISPCWGKVRLNAIKRPDIVTFLNDVQKDATHNVIKTTLQAIQDQALDMALIPVPFMFGIKRRPEGVRTKILTSDEIITIMTADHGWDGLRNICKMQLLTGCRVSEVAGMRWDEVDMKDKIWTIPPERIKTEKQYKKMNRSHCIPFMPKMAEILLNQRRHGTKGLIFKKMMSKGAYSASAAGDWLKKELNIVSGTHQLRRTVSTSMADMKNISEFDIKILLNHTP